jgi:ribosomal protein S18 acetylase RimI-like enzyme
MRIRATSAEDGPFLRQMLYEAAFWRPGSERPPLESALARPELLCYLASIDAGVIALERDRRVGAAWYGRFSPAAPGRAFIDERTPELTIAVCSDHRERGVGTALLLALLEQAREAGVAVLALSVEPDNPARRLYERHGFTKVGENGGAWTMCLDLQ